MFSLIIIVGFGTFIGINSAPNDRITGKGAWAYSTEIEVRCFSGDSLVRLSNGKQKQISYLKSGDQLLTFQDSKIVPSEMIMMLDKQISTKVEFYTLRTHSGHQISLTKFHLIPIRSFNGNEIYLFAKQVQIGDQLFVLLNGKMSYSPILNRIIEYKNSSFAPLTSEGTLLVNDVLASSFALISNHHLAQFSMFPFRLYYKFSKYFFLTDPFPNNQSDGMHWLIEIIFHFVRYWKPDTFKHLRLDFFIS